MIKLKTLGPKLFAKFFGFDEGIDITNDVAVLYRKNVVIKNIIFLSNILYTLIFLGLSLFRQSDADWLMTILFFPITYGINSLLKKLINQDKEDKTKLQVAMYVAAFYMFLSSVLVYIRLVAGEPVIYNEMSMRLFEAASYVLIFYALIVISLYQDKKVLSNIFTALLAVITIIHFTVTYSVMNQGLSLGRFLVEFLPTPEFGDILLRTVVFMVFFLVVYSIVAIGQQLQEERKKELLKRRQVQGDFAHIVKDLFSVVFSTSATLLDRQHSLYVHKAAALMVDNYDISSENKERLYNYVDIHLRFGEIKNEVFDQNIYDEKSYEILKERTELGSKIARRLQLAQKAQDIVRSVLEGTTTDEFLTSMQAIQPEIESQIILLADIYITMRSVKSYKRPRSHVDTLKIFDEQFAPYFDYNLKEAFLRFNEQFDELYSQL